MGSETYASSDDGFYVSQARVDQTEGNDGETTDRTNKVANGAHPWRPPILTSIVSSLSASTPLATGISSSLFSALKTKLYPASSRRRTLPPAQIHLQTTHPAHPVHPSPAHIRSAPLSFPPSNLCYTHILPAKPKHAVVKLERVPNSTHQYHTYVEDFEKYDCCKNRKKNNDRESQKRSRVMGLSKTQRIGILLAIDGGFFLVELICGYAVHSLALVADAFHMLNDVLSLCVGLWAVRRAKAGRSSMYTYGWQRAETLGALVNGVFLVALCMTIFLEAITRFVEPQEVTNPKLVLIVGCLGLASNIIGLVLFHDVGHSHGGEEGSGHSHDAVKNAEEGHSHSHATENVHWVDETTRLVDNNGGSIEDVLPTVRIAGAKGSVSRKTFSKSDESNTTVSTGEASSAYKRKLTPQSDNKHRRRSSFFTSSIDDMPIHPAGRRDEIIQASQIAEDQSDTGTEDVITPDEGEPLNERQTNGKTSGYGSIQSHDHHEYSHANHNHRQPKEQKSGGGGHGHSHGDLNMRGVFLHVLGDALGNVGVIVTALIIWLCTFPQRFYFDPGVSLVITCIILYTAIPLCKAASRILLQAVPSGMDVEEIRADIESLKGIKSAHHMHVWQLSDTKHVASLHIRIGAEIKHTGTAGYMRLAREVQECLREHGIRSSTIQPEFETDDAAEHHHDHLDSLANGSKSCPTGTCKPDSLNSGGSDKVCMLDSEDAGAVADRADGHDHDHEHEHEGHDDGNGKNKDNHQH